MRGLLGVLVWLQACSGDEKKDRPPADAGGDAGVGEDAAPEDAAPEDAKDPKPPTLCETLDLPERDFSDGPYGALRHEIAGDFSVELVDGSLWTLGERWTGCESYVFVPDTLPRSGLDSASIWEQDVDRLIEDSPPNVHYFFVSRQAADWAASANAEAMQERIDEATSLLPTPEDTEYWRARLHAVRTRAGALDGWLADVLDRGYGRIGLGIDRFQLIRGVGSFADVNRFSGALDAAGMWPWEANLAYAANEARHWNFEAERQERIDATDWTTVTFWTGEVLSELEEIDVELPPAAEMATFDTFEIDVTARCPESDDVEFGNCGAWDYLAWLFVYDEKGARIELGRFITSYHREGRFVVDATPMLVHLRAGGSRRFRWEFAPPWNVQPTATWLDLRFANRGGGASPAAATFLWSGGGFGSAYDDGRTSIDVPISADAVRVELWAVITGHGMGTNNCAEFCDHEHEFTVNGTAYTRDHPAIGNQTGCVDEIENGAVPNQWGTWWFGRGGWCPGQQVEPFVVDVTGDVVPGETATVSYRGLYRGDTPPDGSGDIVMTSYLVVYE